MTVNPGTPPPPAGSAATTSTGLDPRLAGVLAYLFWIIGGILFLATEKQNSVVRFHAAQSVVVAIAEIVVWIALTILSIIVPFLGLLFIIVWLGVFVLWLLLMWKAWQLERWKLPILGDYAEKLAAKSF